MRKHFRTLIAALLIIGLVPVVAGARFVERHSTYPGSDVDRISFSGKITSITGQKAYVALDDGGHMTVHLGPQWYWHERGYSLRSGLHVNIGGWIDPEDDSYCFAGSIAGDGFYFDLADSHGYPRWADPCDYSPRWRPRHRTFEIHYYHAPRCAPPWWRHRPHYRHYSPPGHRHHPGPGWHHHPRHHDGPRHDGPPPRDGNGPRPEREQRKGRRY